MDLSDLTQWSTEPEMVWSRRSYYVYMLAFLWESTIQTCCRVFWIFSFTISKSENGFSCVRHIKSCWLFCVCVCLCSLLYLVPNFHLSGTFRQILFFTHSVLFWAWAFASAVSLWVHWWSIPAVSDGGLFNVTCFSRHAWKDPPGEEASLKRQQMAVFRQTR